MQSLLPTWKSPWVYETVYLLWAKGEATVLYVIQRYNRSYGAEAPCAASAESPPCLSRIHRKHFTMQTNSVY